ncbi:MAG: NAD-dependent epimerase/dehydratase family protein [Bryobacteraceae bacterium]
MRILITGACGFVGSSVAESLLERRQGLAIMGLDNLMRPGSETNRARLRKLGVALIHADIRTASDLENLPAADWVIDAAASPSVLAGVEGALSSRQLFEHNLASLVNVLEYSKRHKAGFVLLSSSRVYSIAALRSLPLKIGGGAFQLDGSAPLPAGVSLRGIGEAFSTAPPISLYGSTKLAAEAIALEYGEAFGFPVWVNRCGVLAGAGQFGTPDQGIFSYWVNAHLRRRPLRYLGFEGAGCQVRDAFHPRDLAALVDAQIGAARQNGRRVYVAGGGASNAMSLAQVTAWCDARFGPHAPARDPSPRLYDIPWMIMDSAEAERDFGWRPETSLEAVLEEIASHAEGHPEWLETSGV